MNKGRFGKLELVGKPKQNNCVIKLGMALGFSRKTTSATIWTDRARRAVDRLTMRIRDAIDDGDRDSVIAMSKWLQNNFFSFCYCAENDLVNFLNQSKTRTFSSWVCGGEVAFVGTEIKWSQNHRAVRCQYGLGLLVCLIQKRSVFKRSR